MSRSIDERLRALVRDERLPDRTPCLTIAVADIERLAAELGQSVRSLEMAALQGDIVPQRYLRNRQTLSVRDQRKLLEAQACIVGLGGLGGLVAETLARLGVGRLRLVDGDRFEGHNLNRQLLSRSDNLGTGKAAAAAERMAAVNPGVDVTVRDIFLTAATAAATVRGCDVVIDCLDNIHARFELQSAAQSAGIPMISAAVAGLSGHVTAIFPGDQGLETIYGADTQHRTDRGAETRLGNLAPVVNLVASLECAEALKILLDRPHTLRGRLLVVDLTDGTFETLQLT